MWTSIVLIISLLAPSVAQAAAASSQGEGGSITLETVNANTGEVIPDGLLRPDTPVRIVVHAFDSMGKSIPCGKPKFGTSNGPAGNQIEGVDEQPDGTGLMRMGTSFGSAEVQVSCENLPNVKAKMPVVNNTLQGGKVSAFDQPPPAQATPGAETPAAGGAGSAATGILVGLAVAAGVAALVVGLSSSASTTCSHPNLWCRTPDTCCPPGYFYYCTTPAAKVGCYNDVFIDGCNLKYGCSGEY